MDTSDQQNSFPRVRRSACADASLRAEIRRVGKMTTEERIRAALSLGKITKGFQPHTKDK